MPFDIIQPEKSGFLGLEAEDLIPQDQRGKVLSSGGIVTDEQIQFMNNYQLISFSEPGNTLLWEHTQVGNLAPRGAWGSWSFAMPAKHIGNDEWLPMIDAAGVDLDYLKEKVKVIGGRRGRPIPFGAEGIVLATTKHGAHEKVAFLAAGPGSTDLIAHWRGNRPPELSTHCFDIAGSSPDPDRHAGLHTTWEVREWAAPCSGVTSSGEVEFAIALNARSATDGTGFLFTTYGGFDACHSFLASGPLRYATSIHKLNETNDAPIHSGAIDTNAYYTGGRRPFDGPIEFIEEDWPNPPKGKYPKKVEILFDEEKKHPFKCREKKGMWRLVCWDDITTTPKCDPTKDYSEVDAVGNIRRTYAEAQRIFSDKKMQSSGMYFQSRPNINQGRPIVVDQHDVRDNKEVTIAS